MFCFCDILYFVVDLVYFLIERITVGCMVCPNELREVKGYDKIYCMKDLRKNNAAKAILERNGLFSFKFQVTAHNVQEIIECRP